MPGREVGLELPPGVVEPAGLLEDARDTSVASRVSTSSVSQPRATMPSGVAATVSSPTGLSVRT